MYTIRLYKQGFLPRTLPGDYKTLDEAIEDAKLYVTAFHRSPLLRITVRRKHSQEALWEWIRQA